MSTRARIGRRNADGSVTSIFLYFDGGPATVMTRLSDTYTVGRAVDVLLAGGDRQTMDRPAIGQPAAKASGSVADYLQHARECWAEHAYLFDGGCWWHRPLMTQALQ